MKEDKTRTLRDAFSAIVNNESLYMQTNDRIIVDSDYVRSVIHELETIISAYGTDESAKEGL